MKIEWNRFIAYNLPVILRRPRVFNFIRELLAAIRDLHDRSETWRADALRRSAYDSSAIMMERMLLDQMGVVAEISDSQRPDVDFIVTIVDQGDSYDDARLRALIDRYKQADKSYIIENGDIAYSAAFSDYVCEQLDESYSAGFTSYVCETTFEQRQNILTLVIDQTEAEWYEIYAVALYPVASQLTIVTTGGIQLTMYANMLESEHHQFSYGDLQDKYDIESITPEQDEEFHYIYEKNTTRWRTTTQAISDR